MSNLGVQKFSNRLNKGFRIVGVEPMSGMGQINHRRVRKQAVDLFMMGRLDKI